MTDNYPSDRILEDASHAAGQYITRGPSILPGDMNIVGLEGTRARLNRSPYAEHHEIAGWAAVEQAFAVAGNPNLRGKYSVDSLFVAAEDSFTLALDRYEEAN